MKPVIRAVLASLTLLLLTVTPTTPASASNADLDGGLQGFTSTGVLIGTPSAIIEIPFAPSLQDDRVALDMQALHESRVSDIYVPVTDTARHADLSVSYEDQILLATMPPPPPPVPQIPFFQKLDARLKGVKKLASRIDHIINPTIRTRNFDIHIQLQGLIH